MRSTGTARKNATVAVAIDPYLRAMPVASPYRSVQRVYFDDLDALNILHNVRYLLFIERARGELFQALGFVWQDDLLVNPDKWHVVAAHDIQYLVPVRGEGDLVVELTPTKLGRSSFSLRARVCSLDGKVTFAEGSTRLVRLDPATQRPCPWSDRFRSALRGMLPDP
jgi:acyl-CoA thioester hydrolase